MPAKPELYQCCRRAQLALPQVSGLGQGLVELGEVVELAAEQGVRSPTALEQAQQALQAEQVGWAEEQEPASSG